MDQLGDDRERFLALIRHWHAEHPRRDQVEHCINVASLLERALDLEATPIPARRDMTLAALGHDLYEDSKIPREQVAADYGKAVDHLIRALTEEQDGVGPYVERMASAPEEARLIKFCDGIDNYCGLVEKKLLDSDPAYWVRKVRQHMEPMFSRLKSVPFRQYPAAGAWLGQMLKDKREGFWRAVEGLLRAKRLGTGDAPSCEGNQDSQE